MRRSIFIGVVVPQVLRDALEASPPGEDRLQRREFSVGGFGPRKFGPSIGWRLTGGLESSRERAFELYYGTVIWLFDAAMVQFGTIDCVYLCSRFLEVRVS